ncbi:SAM-dependent methyltransferase [Dehalogenimonas etheniformans]|uniref:Class I SAM-dependent methyltransferase n=1 Tax=Dehalogenimonas etheniformans TaxID=1536648 RepID=A0A2P5P833_9CHLR|nr:class I SAM-dependent methyltransferase [Dehalogenimonas etheniformans]PPD58462.1 class I SAM-dependent methyltransferase [Dehalogenimonas etheniformans]QNT75853.1 class I SAM-dependent methyltransferase [Dehalogenimonas etheniformans]
MEFFDLMSISHRYMEILNPSTPEKIIKLGKLLQLGRGSRVIDFGCGCAEHLTLWAEEFGIGGVGIDICEDFCDRARKKLALRGLSDKIEIVCSNGADYVFEEGAFDAATCIGATFIFGDYQKTVQILKRAVHQNGRLGIGETHWLSNWIDPEYAQKQTTTNTESALARLTRDEGFELEYIIRASSDDWDRYISDSWYGFIRWLEENPMHPDYEQVQKYFRSDQDDYLRFQRQYMGWAMYCLAPMNSY